MGLVYSGKRKAELWMLRQPELWVTVQTVIYVNVLATVRSLTLSNTSNAFLSCWNDSVNVSKVRVRKEIGLLPDNVWGMRVTRDIKGYGT